MVILREQRKHAKYADAGRIQEESITCCGENSALIGFAADIGTTTIALTAVDLRSGNIIGSLSEMNEQTKLGADVMMRVMHSLSGKRGKLHEIVVQQIEGMAKRILAEKAMGIDVGRSRFIFSVVGNTVMCHLFLDQDVAGLAGYPFRPAYTGNYHCCGKDIGMDFFSCAEVYVLSGIAAHVGSDALAVIGAEGLYGKDKIQLAIDLGTNAEIILNQRGTVKVCSTAAGPAFEGKGIQCGMPAKEGAVNGIKMSSTNGNIVLEYICGRLPRGICGSGLVDAVAGLRKCRVLQPDGYLLSADEAERQKIQTGINKRITKRNGQNAFLFYADEEYSEEIYLQQSDIRGVQLAKGAIQAGIQCLLSESRLKLSEVDEIVVAGVLGSCMRPANAVSIGLLPDTLPKLRFAGNAAGRGAVRILTDKSFFGDMERLAGQISHVELAQMEDFQGHLMRSMELAPFCG